MDALVWTLYCGACGASSVDPVLWSLYCGASSIDNVGLCNLWTVQPRDYVSCLDYASYVLYLVECISFGACKDRYVDF